MRAMSHIAVVFLVLFIVTTVCAGAFFVQANPYGTLITMNSGSMCITHNEACTGRRYSDEPTIHVNDIILCQPVNPADLKTNYPDSDIIVFRRPEYPKGLYIRRIVKKEDINGDLYFYTKSDGDGADKYPSIPQQSEYDPWPSNDSAVPLGALNQDSLVGKVVNTNFPLLTLLTELFLTAFASFTCGCSSIILFLASRKAALKRRVPTRQVS